MFCGEVYAVKSGVVVEYCDDDSGGDDGDGGRDDREGGGVADRGGSQGVAREGQGGDFCDGAGTGIDVDGGEVFVGVVDDETVGGAKRGSGGGDDGGWDVAFEGERGGPRGHVGRGV